MREARGQRSAAPLPVRLPAREDERMLPNRREMDETAHPAEAGVNGSAAAAPGEAAMPPGQQPCPSCGHPMPDLKGGTASICAVCGFKDSCCY
jgi:hypothetical protein